MSHRSHSPSDSPFVSVIVPTYGRDEVLCDTLRGLLNQDYPRYEIIVVSQTPAHSQETVQFLRTHQDHIRQIRLQRPSLPRARNVGILDARGDVVLFVDDDVIPSNHLISSHVSAYRDPDIGGVAGQVLPPDGEAVSRSQVGGLDHYTNVIWNFHSDTRTYVEHACGANMSFRRDLLVDAGMFEPAFGGTAFYEDTDLSLRVAKVKSGTRILFEPQASLIHLAEARGGCGNRNRNPRWYYWYMHNSMLLALRHRDRFNPASVVAFHARKILGELKDPPLLPLWSAATVHAHLSYARSRRTLGGRGQRSAMSQRPVPGTERI